MPIGTTSGKHYPDAWSQALGQHYDDSVGEGETPTTKDQNVIDPEQFFYNQERKNDPNNVYNDQGDIVSPLKKLPSVEEFEREWKKMKPEMQPDIQQEADPQFVPIGFKESMGPLRKGLIGAAAEVLGEKAMDKIFGTPEEAFAKDVEKYGVEKARELYRVRGGVEEPYSRLDKLHSKVDEAITPTADAIEDRVQSTVDFIRQARRQPSSEDTDRALEEIRRALEETGGAEPVSRSHSPRQATGFEQTPYLGGMSDTEMMAYVQNNPQQALDPIDIERYDRLVPRGLENRAPGGVEDWRTRPLRGRPRGYEGDRITLSTGESLDEGRPFSTAMKARIAEAKSGKDLNFFSKDTEAKYGKHYFASEKGVGEANVSYRAETKTIKVGSVGIIENDKGEQISPLSDYSFKHGPQTFGIKEGREIVKYLKDKYPEAEWLTGFRVSGARQKTGSGSANAKPMWIGKGPKPKEATRSTLEELQQAWDDDAVTIRSDAQQRADRD